MAIAPADGIGGPGVSQVDDERLVRELGMSIAPGGVAYVASELRLENGQMALPELIAMTGWTVEDLARAVRAARWGNSSPRA
jgi:hypothetical protein